jgi:integrase
VGRDAHALVFLKIPSHHLVARLYFLGRASWRTPSSGQLVTAHHSAEAERKWHGWHGFRRGLATNLYTLGVLPKVIQNILRHASVETTQTHYIVIESQKMKAAMKAFSRAVGKEWAKNGKRTSRKLLKSKAKPR